MAREDVTAELRQWAADRRLTFTEEETLPPATPLLRSGAGLGEHRSLLRDLDGPFGSTVDSDLARRPERQTVNVCVGTLPGGLDGRLGHHIHLIDRGPREGTRWVAISNTVVYAKVPSGARAACTVTAVRGSGSVVPETELPANPDPLAHSVTIPARTIEAEGMKWRSWPAEDHRVLQTIAGPGVRRALADVPPETRIELEFGTLCVATPGRARTDPAVLDALCRLAAELATAIAAAARYPSLDPQARLNPPPDTPRERWIAAGAALVRWDEPPSSVAAAQAAYEPVVARAARRRGRRAGRITMLVTAVIALISTAAWAGSWLAFGEPGIALAAPLLLLGGLVGAARYGRKASKSVRADLTAVGKTAWGLEAFARGYAASRGLVVEDPDELRRRLPAVLPGRAQQAWHGDLGGTPGHLALWIDPTLSPTPARHWLVAAVPACAIPAEASEDRLVATADGVTVIAERVAADERDITRLDALRARAAAAALDPAQPSA